MPFPRGMPCMNLRIMYLKLFLVLTKAFDTVFDPLLLKKWKELVSEVRNVIFLVTTWAIERNMLKLEMLSVTIYLVYRTCLVSLILGRIIGPTLFLVNVNELCKLELQNGQITSYEDERERVGKKYSYMPRMVLTLSPNGCNVLTLNTGNS